MSKQNVSELQKQHRALDNLIKIMYNDLSVPDEYIKYLKRRKLALKTKIEINKLH